MLTAAVRSAFSDKQQLSIADLTTISSQWRSHDARRAVTSCMSNSPRDRTSSN